MQLAYCARSLACPQVVAAATLARLGLAAEIADDGLVDEALWLRSGLPIVTVQAWWLHEAHPLHPARALRERARRRIVETLDLAVRLRAPRVLAVCGFGDVLADRPFERCRDFFAGVAPAARERGLVVLLEPLSPRRCAAMWQVDDVVRLHDDLAAPDVFRLCLDTGHLVDSGRNVGAVFAALGRPLEEVQWKGARSAPPDPDDPVAAWIAALPTPPAVFCPEHNVPLAPPDVDVLVDRLRSALGAFVMPPPEAR